VHYQQFNIWESQLILNIHVILSFFVAKKICFVVTSFIRKTQCGKMCILKQKILERRPLEKAMAQA
jgi:hypothetical protein